MFPTYREIQLPLLAELRRRGGSTRPSDTDSRGRTVYEALADYFSLSKDARQATIDENGSKRSKWRNMVRWARNDLRKLGYLYSPQRGLWALTETGEALLISTDAEVAGRGDLLAVQFIDPQTFLASQREADRIGRRGEEFVLAYEKNRLIRNGRADLARKVKWVSAENVAAGYDVLSYDKDGSERFIEVKAGKSDNLTFFMTSNELETARRIGNSYWLYKVVRIETDFSKVIELRNPAELVELGYLHLRPTVFAVVPGEGLDV